MLIEKGKITTKDLGYNKNLSRGFDEQKRAIYQGDNASGDLKGLYPNPAVEWSNFDVGYSEANKPEWKEGRLYYNTDTHKLNIGGETGWEEITSAIVPSASISPSLSASISSSVSPSASLSPSISPSLSASISSSISPSSEP
jgi:hypothetical protein